MINILFLAPCRVAPLTVIKYFSEPRIKEKVKSNIISIKDTYEKNISELKNNINFFEQSISLINNILDHQFYNTVERHSLDIRDYDINFVKGLSVEDALANLNFFLNIP